MHRMSKLKLSEINPYLTCQLCNGYFIDPCTVQECLHSFCRSCIVGHLYYHSHCPVCSLVIHKTRPLEMIRHDQTLQDIVYKLVPGVFAREMERRRHYYVENKDADDGVVGAARGEVKDDQEILAEDDIISMALVHSPNGDDKPPSASEGSTELLADIFLRCPASFPVSSIKKFLTCKYDLPVHVLIDVFHSDESLSDDYTLMDIANIYTWRRRGPLTVFYTIYKYSPAARPDETTAPQSEECHADESTAKETQERPSGEVAESTILITEQSSCTEVTAGIAVPAEVPVADVTPVSEVSLTEDAALSATTLRLTSE